MSTPRLSRCICRATALAAFAFWTADAGAQTWATGRTTPSLRELVTVDATGEPNWAFGREDLAGDGLDTFLDTEQSVDVRSAYAASRGRRLWLRVYVSAEAPADALAVFVFVDNDRDATTGGDALAPEVDAVLTEDPSPGGYELIIGIRREPEEPNVWQWQANDDRYEPVSDLEPLDLVVEADADRDPLDIGSPPNGYVQIALDATSLGISLSCDANLLFRASDGEGRGDRDVGVVGPCVPGDADRNGVADVAEVETSCTNDEQCPAGGECVEGACRAPSLVIAGDEIVQGGALTCEAAGSSRRTTQAAWLGVGVAVAALARRRRRGGPSR